MITKVFGIGLNKTGTYSLAEALNVLGVKTIHYPHDIITYNEIISGNYNLSFLKEYDGCTDLTLVSYYVQLDQIFPNSKFILTIRDEASWLRSIENHYAKNSRLYEDYSYTDDYKKVSLFIAASVYGCYKFNKERFLYCFRRHNKEVVDYFVNRDNLLIYDICSGQNWPELCSFLEKDMPNISFPHKNKSF